MVFSKFFLWVLGSQPNHSGVPHLVTPAAILLEKCCIVSAKSDSEVPHLVTPSTYTKHNPTKNPGRSQGCLKMLKWFTRLVGLPQ